MGKTLWTAGDGLHRKSMRGAAAVAALLWVVVPARAIDADTVYLETLVPALEDVRYADAMIDCAASMLSSGRLACAHVPADKELRHSFWVWRNEENDVYVNRTLSGDYRLREPGCLSGFCGWQECRITKWPTFSCDDGTTREGAVEDRVRLILDDTTYERVRQE